MNKKVWFYLIIHFIQRNYIIQIACVIISSNNQDWES